MSEVWRTYRANFGPILGLAVILEGILSVLYVPVGVARVAWIVRLWREVLASPNLARSGFSHLWTTFPSSDPAIAAALGFLTSLGALSAMLLSGAVAIFLLAPRSEERSIRGSLRVVRGRWMPLAIPMVVLGLGFAAASGLQAIWLARFSALDPQNPAGFADARSAFGVAPLFAILVPAIEIAVIYLVVRWAVAIPALFVEGLGLRSALRRSSELTRGRRLSIALFLAMLGVVVGLLGWLVIYLPAFAVGALLGFDSPVGLAAASIVAIAGLLLTAPFLPIALAILYRDFRVAGPRAVPPFETSPAGWRPEP